MEGQNCQKQENALNRSHFLYVVCLAIVNSAKRLLIVLNIFSFAIAITDSIFNFFKFSQIRHNFLTQVTNITIKILPSV